MLPESNFLPQDKNIWLVSYQQPQVKRKGGGDSIPGLIFNTGTPVARVSNGT